MLQHQSRRRLMRPFSLVAWMPEAARLKQVRDDMRHLTFTQAPRGGQRMKWQV